MARPPNRAIALFFSDSGYLDAFDFGASMADRLFERRDPGDHPLEWPLSFTEMEPDVREHFLHRDATAVRRLTAIARAGARDRWRHLLRL